MTHDSKKNIFPMTKEEKEKMHNEWRSKTPKELIEDLRKLNEEFKKRLKKD